MSEWKNHSRIEFSGLALHPSFSIYMIEIVKGKNRFFYVGMTGDGHYPSARSILHRLAGHIDLSKKSTQSQLMKGIKEKIFDNKETLTESEWASLHIKLHHWPIEGFEPWNGDLKEINKESNDYLKYKEIQNQVAKLEKKIIGEFGNKLLNRGKSQKGNILDSMFSEIYNDIKRIVDHG